MERSKRGANFLGRVSHPLFMQMQHYQVLSDVPDIYMDLHKIIGPCSLSQAISLLPEAIETRELQAHKV